MEGAQIEHLLNMRNKARR